MRKLYTTAYNKTLQEELEKLREMAESITAENIKFFPETLLNDVSSYLDIWSDNATINSVKYKKLRSLIDHLRINKLEYKTLYREVSIAEDVEIEVPEGFDGRDCFVQLSTHPNGIFENSLTNLKRAFSNWYGLTSEGIIQAKQRLAVQKNKNFINIEFDISQDLAGYGQTIYCHVILWRLK